MRRFGVEIFGRSLARNAEKDVCRHRQSLQKSQCGWVSSALQLLYGQALDQPALVQNGDSAAYVVYRYQIVRDIEKRRTAGPVQSLHESDNLCLSHRIQGTRRFVCDQYVRSMQKGQRNRYSLRLPYADLRKSPDKKLAVRAKLHCAE